MKTKKQKSQKKCAIKGKIKFEDFKYFLEATQHENIRNQREKNKVDVDSLRRDQKEFIKNNKFKLKSQQ